jgi:hypothetical protein
VLRHRAATPKQKADYGKRFDQCRHKSKTEVALENYDNIGGFGMVGGESSE